MAKYKIVHYLNQFYGGIGGEDMAGVAPELREGTVGPGMQLAKELGLTVITPAKMKSAEAIEELSRKFYYDYYKQINNYHRSARYPYWLALFCLLSCRLHQLMEQF